MSTPSSTKAEFGSPAPPSATTPAPSTTAPSNDEYPEQRHAGRVGLGPNYGKGAVSGVWSVGESLNLCSSYAFDGL